MIYTVNKYYSTTNKCLYMKAYCLIDRQPYSIYSDILLYIIHDLILDIVKKKYEKMDIHTKAVKFGKYRYCVIEFIVEQDLSAESVDEFIGLIKKQLEINVYNMYYSQKEYYIGKSIFNKEENQKNNFAMAKLLADSVLYNIYQSNEFDEKIMIKYLKNLSSGKLNLFILCDKKYNNICNKMVPAGKNSDIVSPLQYYKKEIKIRRATGCNVLLFIFPIAASYKVGEVVSLIMGMKLHKEIRDENGLAYYVGCMFDKFENTISILIGTNYSTNIKKIEIIINRVIHKFKINGIEEKDLKRCELYRRNQELYIIDEALSYLSYEFECSILDIKLMSDELVSVSVFSEAMKSISYDERVSIIVEVCD